MIKRFFSIVLCVIICIFIVSCDSNLKNYSKTIIDYFDTVITVSGYFYTENDFKKCFEKIESRLSYYNKLFDIYQNYNGVNNIKTINDNAGIKKVKVEKDIIELLVLSKKMYNVTNGYLNVCLGSVLSVWHNYRLEGKTVPSIGELKQADKYSSIDNLVIDENNSTVFLKKKNCKLDVGAVAKGFVCEKIKDFAVNSSLKNGIINLGGNVTVIGKKTAESDYIVGIKNPDKLSENILKIHVRDLSVVTSGNYERYYEVDGKRYNHIISPYTLMPSEENKSVTVVSDNSAVADALSTVLFMLDYNECEKLIKNISNCEFCLINADGKVFSSSGFEKLIVK